MRVRTQIFIGLCVLALVAAAALFYLYSFSGKRLDAPIIYAAPTSGNQVFSQYPAQVSTTTNVQPPPAGYVQYKNDQYHFSVYYPANLTESFYDEGGGAATITFQDVASVQGFQIFVVPYAGNMINEQRFQQDEPSGVRNDVQDVSIDGAIGASFFSTDAALGDTAEIWFIHGGYLYEVTTLKPLATWLSQIMQTWQFI